MDLIKRPVTTTVPDYACDGDALRNGLELVVKNWIRRGEQIPLIDVPYCICYTISRHFPPQYETWKELASELYVAHKLTHFDLDQIEGDARVCGKWPSQVLLLYCSSETDVSFSALLTVLYKKLKRLDCLQSLYDENHVAEFLEIRESQLNLPSSCSLSQRRKIMEDTLSEPIDRLNKCTLKSVTDNLKFRKKHVNQLDLEGLLEKPTMREILQVINACRVPSNTKTIKNNDDEPIKPNSPILKMYQCVNSSRRLVILLTYSADVNTDIPAMVQNFWDASIGVVAEWVLRGKGYFETNPRDSWENFFKQCNFVVPVISPQYLRDIQNPSDNDQGLWVRFVYDLYTRKYVTDGCLNNVVRPLVMDNVQKKTLQKVNPTLSMRWRLQEMDDFIDMLKKNSQYHY